MTPKTLLDLPDELLLQLPLYIQNIEDFKNASSACRHLRNVFADTLPKTILRLASRSAPTFFSPHPHFLVLAVARQIATWAVASGAGTERRVERLVEAFRDGMKGILSLALHDDVEGVGLTMDDVRRMYEARFTLINPLNTTIDAMVGKQWYAQPNFWNGGAEDAFTLYADVSSATFQLLVYGELFGSTMASYLQPSDERKPGLGIDTRIEFIKYCIPDMVCTPNTSRTDGFEVLPLGPYAEGAEGNPDGEKVEGNQTALAHLVGGAMFEGVSWKRVWRRVLIAAGAEDNEDGKWPKSWIERIQRTEFRNQRSTVEREMTDLVGGDDDVGNEASSWRFFLFWNALTQAGGLQTMDMVAQFKGREENHDAAVMKPEWKAHILRLRDQLLALNDKDEPGFKELGRRRKLKVSEAPNLGAELYWCCAGMWSGL
ncbi:hypothetical protein P171DRAFT_428532 [Karstenula rhodostoma CBS 690.94]|uniref:F-box domain-containing protein n=1 Tax=Karstenula rhodostoma CBS 690.94 TaxID=1392251 RepID=A0A9P4PNN5_9PLEO|nr:hypothetical protein P171DRAFT_428532 [Karstenula rhodostoma CBS 690.94]